MAVSKREVVSKRKLIASGIGVRPIFVHII